MKIKVLAAPRDIDNSFTGEIVNGIDLTRFPEGGRFISSEQLDVVGIYGIERVQGELWVVLGQLGLPYECQPVDGYHDWRGTGEWIDAADYDPNRCYIVATSAPEGAEYIKRENGWTVTLPETEEEPTP